MPSVFDLAPSHISRIDTEAHHIMAAYAQDCQFFHTHENRRAYIRAQVSFEFDPLMDQKYFHRLPTLHVLVCQLSPQVHHIVPLYRGASFWPTEIHTDAEVASIAAECHKKKGMNIVQVMLWAETHDSDFDPNEFWMMLHAPKVVAN